MKSILIFSLFLVLNHLGIQHENKISDCSGIDDSDRMVLL